MSLEFWLPVLIGVALVKYLIILLVQSLARISRNPKLKIEKRTMPDHSQDG